VPVTRDPMLIRGGHVSTLHALSSELSDLHREMLRTGHDEIRPVRTAVLTLVCICTDDDDADQAAEVVRRLATNHPSRVVLVVADRNATPDGVDADLSLECSAVGGSDQICAETVRLAVRGQPALHLTSLVTPLLLPDVPVVLWLADAPPLEQALHAEVVAVCERIVLDSDAYDDPLDTLRTLDRAHRALRHLPIGDLAWSRLTPWRELLAQSFDGRDMAPFLHGVQRVAVESCGARPSSEAWLLAGWLGSRLDWAHDAPPRIDVTTRGDSTVEEGGLLSVSLRCALDGRSADVLVRRNGDTTVTRIETSDGLTAGGIMATPAPDLYALVGGELQQFGEDTVYVEALYRAVALARSGAMG
jgi:glucose-6-phosphate dehydrogenase assembly protein OpcA